MPLYLLPFDHRESYVREMFGFTPPVAAVQREMVTDSKELIYEGFRQALADGVRIQNAGIMIDEDFGAPILRDAIRRGYITAVATERSGAEEFDFEYGMDFAAHISAFKPTFAKALVRYNPEGDAVRNKRQERRLRALSMYCRVARQRFMLELLVPPTLAQTRREDYDSAVRPELTVQAISALQDAGIEPDVWKVEGLDHRKDCQRIVAMARRDGRGHVECIVLGQGASEAKVRVWLATAASVPGFTGFAVGRTTFWDPVRDYVAGRATRRDASLRIANRFHEWVETFEASANPGAQSPRGPMVRGLVDAIAGSSSGPDWR